MTDERFPLVDADGAVIGSAWRSECHGNPALLHPVVHCIVVNAAGEMLLQRRSHSKKIQPGKWDTAVGGHVGVGESIESALRREVAEEIGLNLETVASRFLYRYNMVNDIESELVHTYVCESDGPFRPQASEVDELRFWPLEKIRAKLGTGVFTPNFEDEFERYRAVVKAE